MSCTFDCWVIGYGNIQRQDDGIGPYVADLVEISAKRRTGIKSVSLHQLDPAMVEELQHASVLIFVDATMEAMEKGWRWVKIEPECKDFYHVMHLFDPQYLLALIQLLYHKHPETWLVTVQGDNFEFGEGLTIGAEERACGAAAEIVDFLEFEKSANILPKGEMAAMENILIIDDDKDLVNTIRTILESRNYKVTAAYNGKEGYARIEKGPPDLIILDVMMSTDTEGFDLAYKLKNSRLYREIPIIMVTSFPQEIAKQGPERFQHIMGEGWPVSEFIEKPVDPDHLLSVIEQILEEKG